MLSKRYVHDVAIIGSGPNGLAAAVALAREGISVLVIEGHDEPGGGMRTAELTLPGFHHDICSAVHPLAELSLCFRSLPLQQYGLEWIHPPASVANPMDNGPAAILERSIDRTSQSLVKDARRYRALLNPFVEAGLPLFDDLAAPLHWPRHPLSMARFGTYGLQSAARLAGTFQTDRARALLAGCAGHSILPLTRALSGAVGLLFLVAGHLTDWPVARGGSRSITLALARYFEVLGGDLVCRQWITGIDDLPPARAYIFDTSPMQLAQIAGAELPVGYLRRLARYRYGPGVYKLNWALSEPIPWKDPRCALASTVHVGGTLEEIAASEQAA
jgi:phytoene dehydrogenase-like protein